ncbi:rhomboid family intramembrane serine protease [Candidatus Poribacteria bacterium]|nr:rhomboid family intramembrane serine protease [Candidatus Poribacteria bacterium]
MLIPLKTEEPTIKAPVITWLLITANILVFVYQKITIMSNGMDLAMVYGAIPYELTRAVDMPPLSPYSPYLSLLTYMFLHGGIVHILGNMLFLNTFGPNLEDMMGHIKFLLFYVLCGLVSVLVYVLPNFSSVAPLVGASGAIAGVMGAHLRVLPGTRIRCLFFIFPISLPALVILVPWIVLQFYSVFTHAQSNIAWIAHIGGFIFGMFMVRKFRNRWFFKRKLEVIQ